MKLKIATCQFPIDSSPIKNARTVEGQIESAKHQGAHVAHFPEGSLSGYVGRELKSNREIDWERLIPATERVMECAKRNRIWVIVGSAHRLSGDHKPHNSLYIIDDSGTLVDRYDKRFCTGSSENSGDLKHYTPGDHLTVFTIRGLTCGAQICHDFRYQELYREYKREGVVLMFHSYHNGNTTKDTLDRSGNIWGVIVPPTMQTYAANNYMWISANNTSRRESSWPSFFVLPDGVISGRLQRNRAGILISEIDTQMKYYDASVAWRERVMSGVFNSGTLVKDRRSTERQTL